jgi:hypothetical protein
VIDDAIFEVFFLEGLPEAQEVEVVTAFNQFFGLFGQLFR